MFSIDALCPTPIIYLFPWYINSIILSFHDLSSQAVLSFPLKHIHSTSSSITYAPNFSWGKRQHRLLMNTVFGFLVSKHVERNCTLKLFVVCFSLLAHINASLFYPAAGIQLTIQTSNPEGLKYWFIHHTDTHNFQFLIALWSTFWCFAMYKIKYSLHDLRIWQNYYQKLLCKIFVFLVVEFTGI